MPRGFERIEAKYCGLPPNVKNHLAIFPKIVATDDKDTLTVLAAYLFMKIEAGQRRIIYVGVIKKRNTNRAVARTILTHFWMDRSQFKEKYLALSGRNIDDEIIELGDAITPIRNGLIHGKIVDDSKKVKAIKDALDYIKLLNAQTFIDFEFQPFSDLTGFNGRRITNDDATSRQTLVNLGIPVPRENP